MSHLETIRQDVGMAFEPSRFSIPRLPVFVGRVGEFSSSLPCCLDMLIKTPGGDLAVPEPYSTDPAIVDFLAKAAAFEDELLPGWRNTHYAYLTVDQRRVEAGSSHRNAGWHFDGMQGKRYPAKLPVCHQYVVCDHLPTEFASTGVDATGLDYVQDNWFDELGARVSENDDVFCPNVYDVMLMSAYQIHRSPVAQEGQEGPRTFLRFDITMKKFDRVGNSQNPLLPAPFLFVERPMPFSSIKVEDTGWKGGRVYNAIELTARG